MKTQEECNTAWLTYSRGVLSSDALRVCCQFPVASDRPLHERILWPGFIGENYAEKRVMLVGAVHNAAELYTPEIVALADIATHWPGSPETADGNKRYLKSVREAYLTSIERWSEERQKHVAPAHDL